MSRLYEIDLGTIAKVGLGYLALKKVAQLFRSNVPVRTDRNAAKQYAQQLVNARSNQEAVAAALGLLNVCGAVLNSVSSLRFLGSKMMDITKSPAIKKYIES
jgi:hypothetical protein